MARGFEPKNKKPTVHHLGHNDLRVLVVQFSVAPQVAPRVAGVSKSGGGGGGDSITGLRFLFREVSNSKHALISHHCSEKCLGVLSDFRRLEKHPGTSILRSSQLFTHLSGAKLPTLETGEQGDFGR
jgi:hypothetical protein